MGRTIAPQWGRTVVRQGTVLPANQQLVRIDLAEPRDVTLYLSGFRGVSGGTSGPGAYAVTWGCGAAESQIVLVPTVGVAWHVVATRVTVNAELNQAGGGSLQAQAFAALGRPITQWLPMAVGNSLANIGVQHVLPVFQPRFQLQPFTKSVRVQAFNIVAGTPQVAEINSLGATIVTRPAAAYVDGLDCDPRAVAVQLQGVGAEYDALVTAEVSL